MEGYMNVRAPLFSVIVPVYKTEAFLRQCVDSILNQTYPDFQLVLVDDGSPDSSGAICDEYARRDSRVEVVHKQNGGLVSARKAGLAQCRGAYVVNVDSDDYISPDHLSRLAQVIEIYGPDALLFSATRFPVPDRGAMQTTLPAGHYTGEKLKVVRQNLICADDLQALIAYGICLAAMKRDLYSKYQMAAPENISRGEDVAVTVPLLAASDSVYVLDHSGYYYRNNPASLQNTFFYDEVRQIKVLAAHLRSALDATYDAKINLYVATHYFDFLDRAMLIMSYREYRELVRQTLDKELYGYLARAKCKNNRMWQIVFALMRCRLFDALWLLRKVRKRKV